MSEQCPLSDRLVLDEAIPAACQSCISAAHKERVIETKVFPKSELDVTGLAGVEGGIALRAIARLRNPNNAAARIVTKDSEIGPLREDGDIAIFSTISTIDCILEVTD